MRSLLFTGASGFVGSNILSFLNSKYIVDTLGISDSSTYCVDLIKKIPIFGKKYDIILHAAGKAHSIPKSARERQSFYDVNYLGTKNLCTGLERNGLPCSFIFISTVAVYGCESGEYITEDHPLNAKTPYGRSKIQAEKFLSEWCGRNDVFLTILRPSLLAGKNPTGNLATMINGIATGKYVGIANGDARKSIAMAEDIGRLIPYCENKSGIFNLCDDHHPSFKELEEFISKQLHKSLPIRVPMCFAKCLAKFGDLFGFATINTHKLSKMTQPLTFSNERIKKTLNFVPTNVLKNYSICLNW